MHIEAALLAVGDEVLKLTLEIGLHLQQLEPEHLRVGDERIGTTVADLCVRDRCRAAQCRRSMGHNGAVIRVVGLATLVLT
jgi:hypothetical protein